jgi:uncharacterized protein (TIGR03435 family)
MLMASVQRRSAALLFAASSLFAQTFEVASVKPSPSIAELRTRGIAPHWIVNDIRLDLNQAPLNTLIQMAYKVESYQLSGPEWLATTRFDIVAKLPDGATKAQVPEMLQALLADRFKLAVHRESKEQTVYALLAGNDGPKLKEAAPDGSCPARPSTGGRVLLFRRQPDGVDSLCPETQSMLNGKRVFEADQITTHRLALVLIPYVDAPVVDMTGLKGFYRIAFDVGVSSAVTAGARGGLAPAGDSAAQASDPSGVSIFKSVEALGLRMEKRKMPVEHLVIDHLEKAPTEN